jgi:uncharacterized protein YjiS (DUF1127 family)
MAFYTDTVGKDASTATRGIAALSDWLGHISELMARRKVERTTYFELSGLSDRELSDLGICRCDIRRLAREAAKTAL